MATYTSNPDTSTGNIQRSEHKLSGITWAAVALVVIGALNWGLVGLFQFNLVAAIFGDMSVLSRIIYVIVAAAGVYLAVDSTRLRESARLREPRHRPV